MIVVDASCLVEVLLQTGRAAPIETRLRRAGGLHAPELLDLEILQRANFTACDGAYVALAERLRCPVLTRDRKLARSSGHRARIEVL